jgi:hypothetical protein
MDLPNERELRTIVERYARLLAALNRHLGKRPLVLPNGESFPDRFEADEPSVQALVDRMMAHAGMEDVPLTVRVVAEDGPEAPHDGCSSGCQIPAAVAGEAPRLVDDGDEWTLNVPEYELAHPVVLTTFAARALGHVFLVESLPRGAGIEPPVEVTAEYAATALGFGPLLLEGAYIYSKGCGGPSVAQVTCLSLPELAVLSALFIELGGHSARRALGDLGATQRAALSEAHAWAKSNAPLVARLRSEPARVALGDYRLSDAKPWLLRVFGTKDDDRDAPGANHRAPAAAPRAPDPARDELRALVDEALATSVEAE